MKANLLSSTRVQRGVFWATFLLGFASCTRGIGKAPVYGWLHPISISGCLLGGLALLLGGSMLFKYRLPYIKNEGQSLLALFGIILVKAILVALY